MTPDSREYEATTAEVISQMRAKLDSVSATPNFWGTVTVSVVFERGIMSAIRTDVGQELRLKK